MRIEITNFPMTLYEILKNNLLLVYCQSYISQKWIVT